MDPKLATIRKLVGDAAAGGLFTHGVRTLGCSAANITAIATGGLDIYWYVATTIIMRPSADLVSSTVMIGTMGVILGMCGKT